MANTRYENKVIEGRITDLLNTKLNTRSFMTLDTDLAENEGMTKVINRYNYEGYVETVAEGGKNTKRGKVTFTPSEYKVKVSQQVFDYTDEDFMTDSKVVDQGVEGSATLMVNDVNSKFIAELEKGSLAYQYTTFNYDAIVDGMEAMQQEDESNMFIIIGLDLRSAIRKDADFKRARNGEILFNGQIGDVNGIPVVVSKLVTGGKAYIATKEAVTLFTKKEVEVEQARDKETRTNTVISRMVNIVALTNNSKVIKLSKKTV